MPKTWDDEAPLQRELERQGVEFYEGEPSVDVKIHFDPKGPRTKKALANVPDEDQEALLENAWEQTQTWWWDAWRDPNSDNTIALKKLFGKQANAAAAGRSGGHFVVSGANAWDFTDETDDGNVIDEDKVDAWTTLSNDIEESVKKPAIDELLAMTVENLLEE
jgi:hypothetical protein